MGAFLAVAVPTLVTVVSIFVAWQATTKQIQASRTQAVKDAADARDLAERNDTRQRWWEAVRWYHEQRATIGEDAFRYGLKDLAQPLQVKTETQRRTLKAVVDAPAPPPGA